MELRPQGHGVDDDWIVTVEAEHSDLEQGAARGWAEQHGQVFVHPDPASCVADGVLHVRISDPVVTRWLTDPHTDNIPCLSLPCKGSLSVWRSRRPSVLLCPSALQEQPGRRDCAQCACSCGQSIMIPGRLPMACIEAPERPERGERCS